MNAIIDIHKTVSFPVALRLLGVLMIPLPVLPALNPWVAMPFAVMGMALATAHTGVRIDRQNKTCQEYTWLLGIRLGETTSFDRIEYLFLKSNHVRQNMSSRVASNTFHFQVFDGFIRFSETEKVHLFRSRDKAAVMKSLTDAARKVNVDILDYTAS